VREKAERKGEKPAEEKAFDVTASLLVSLLALPPPSPPPRQLVESTVDADDALTTSAPFHANFPEQLRYFVNKKISETQTGVRCMGFVLSGHEFRRGDTRSWNIFASPRPQQTHPNVRTVFIMP